MEERKERQKQTLSLRLSVCLPQVSSLDAAATVRVWPAGPPSGQGLNLSTRVKLLNLLNRKSSSVK